MKNTGQKTKNNLPMFNPKRWKRHLEAGCYSYALNRLENHYLLIGEHIGERCDSQTSEQELIQTLKKELDFLGYDVRETITEDVVEENQFKIFLQRKLRTGRYHFFRQDSDMLWSHKYPKDFPTRSDVLGNTIINPEKMIDEPFKGWCFTLSLRD